MSEILDQLASRLREGPLYRRLRDSVRNGADSAPILTGLPAGAAAWVLETLAADLGRPLVVVMPHETEAREWSTSASTLGGRGDHDPIAAPLTEQGLGRPAERRPEPPDLLSPAPREEAQHPLFHAL